MSDDLYEVGMGIRRKVLGDEYVDAAMRNVDECHADFQRLVTEYCWGACWGRERLSHKQRSLNNLCLLAALNRPQEFEIHLRGALRNGCTEAEIQEVLLQTAAYCGAPAALESFRLAQQVIEQMRQETAVDGQPVGVTTA